MIRSSRVFFQLTRTFRNSRVRFASAGKGSEDAPNETEDFVIIEEVTNKKRHGWRKRYSGMFDSISTGNSNNSHSNHSANHHSTTAVNSETIVDAEVEGEVSSKTEKLEEQEAEEKQEMVEEEEMNLAASLTPECIVAALDKHIVNQKEGKAAVAVALRNRWRRRQLSAHLQAEIHPMNILMIGPTGSGKTEIARRLARLSQAPFVKVEATRYTEVGIYGANTGDMVKDLLEESIRIETEKAKQRVAEQAERVAKQTVLSSLLKAHPDADRDELKAQIESGEAGCAECEVSVETPAAASLPLGLVGVPGQNHAPDLNNLSTIASSLGSIFGNSGAKTKRERFKGTVKECIQRLQAAESEKMIDQESLKRKAVRAVEQTGIIFLDEIDKLAVPPAHERSGSWHDKGTGVQKELLGLIEGSVVSTPHGPVNTEHILFVASGAFHTCKPNDLLPELQGRLPIRVKLTQLLKDDFVKILTETENNLISQQIELLKTEGVNLTVTRCAVDRIAELAADLNSSVENIGARRLNTIIAKVMADISFFAPSRQKTAQEKGQEHTELVDREYVDKQMSSTITHVDLSKFVL
eukprot:CAMPEP_0175156032 /NCGR_PEP_ID=MMETSP0087-20121206/21352_1 /TAXON_ID=136419 /ORGANISM="Unknown Unknown, Strain D1" /LENGTH=581 /DNA_ID=CAMNT_0016443347 /DNA_START=118 /DNA_END=1863 /DNA_ORIENTATION=-